MTQLIHEGETFSVLKLLLIVNCEIFEDDPTLLARSFPVRSAVSAAHVRLFVKAIEGTDPELTYENSAALRLLCSEFKLAEFGRKVDAFVDRWTLIVFQAETVHILRDVLVRTCGKFRDSPSLLTQPYHVTSPVAADTFSIR